VFFAKLFFKVAARPKGLAKKIKKKCNLRVAATRNLNFAKDSKVIKVKRLKKLNIQKNKEF
jgi:hypothetical protein